MYFWMGFLQYRLMCRSEIGQKIRTMARLSIYLYVHEGKIAYWPQYRIAPSYYYTYWLNVSLDLRILIKTFHNEAKLALCWFSFQTCFNNLKIDIISCQKAQKSVFLSHFLMLKTIWVFFQLRTSIQYFFFVLLTFFTTLIFETHHFSKILTLFDSYL